MHNNEIFISGVLKASNCIFWAFWQWLLHHCFHDIYSTLDAQFSLYDDDDDDDDDDDVNLF